MSKKLNTEFLAAFIKLEASCNRLLGCDRHGVSENIDRLRSLDGISEKNEVLSKL